MDIEIECYGRYEATKNTYNRRNTFYNVHGFFTRGNRKFLVYCHINISTDVILYPLCFKINADGLSKSLLSLTILQIFSEESCGNITVLHPVFFSSITFCRYLIIRAFSAIILSLRFDNLELSCEENSVVSSIVKLLLSTLFLCFKTVFLSQFFKICKQSFDFVVL